MENVDNKTNIDKLPIINKISGGISDIQEDVKELEEDFNLIREAQINHLKEISKWCDENKFYANLLDAFIDQEKIRAKKLIEKNSEINTKELALRFIANQCGRLSRRMSEIGKLAIINFFKDKKIFKKIKNLNQYFINNQGSIYVSPFNTNRHTGYDVDLDVIEKINWISEMDFLGKSFLSQLENNANTLLIKDYFLIEQFKNSLILKMLPDEIPSSLIRLRIEHDKLTIPFVIQNALTESNIDKSVAIRVINLYNSAINGFIFSLCREKFMTRVKFSRIGDAKLIYSPKEKNWNIPEKIFKTKNSISNILTNEKFSASELNNQSIEVIKTLDHVLKSGYELEDKKAYLIQSPHELFYPLNIEKTESNKDNFEKKLVIPFSKDDKGKLNPFKEQENIFLKLQGPSSYKNLVVSSIKNQKIRISEMTLIYDQFYQQKIVFHENKVSIKIQKSEFKLELAVPITDQRVNDQEKDNSQSFLDNILGIDLGEKKIGYALFDMKKYVDSGVLDPVHENNSPIVGSVGVPSIRNLMKKVTLLRKKHSPIQNLEIDIIQ